MQRTLLSLALGPGEAELDVRESASLTGADIGALLSLLRADREIAGAYVLSTCGRMEVHVSGVHPARMRAAVLRALREVHGERLDDYQRLLVERRQEEAARHLFRVAAGLESPLLGESQILGQVRSASRLARSAGALDPLVGGTVDRAIAAARRARRESGLGRGAASIGQAAVALLRQARGKTPGAVVLVIGAGEIGSQAARALARAGADLLVASRSPVSAEAVARSTGGEPLGLEAVDGALARVDAVVFSAATPKPLVEVGSVARAAAGRSAPLLVLDLAVPRNVPPAAASLPGVRLFNVDEVAAFAGAGRRRRELAAASAAESLERELEGWRAWIGGAPGAPTLAALAAYADGIRERELQRTMRALGEIDPELRHRIDSLSRALVSRLMLHPISYVRSHPDDQAASELLQRLFSEPPNRP